jgi:hypothetical protein
MDKVSIEIAFARVMEDGMNRRWLRSMTFLAAFLLMAATFTVGVRSVAAQEATPVDGLGEILVHPAHIHSGTCDDLGGVVFPLNDVIMLVDDATIDTDVDATPQPGVDPDVTLDIDATPIDGTPPADDDFAGTPDPDFPLDIGTPVVEVDDTADTDIGETDATPVIDDTAAADATPSIIDETEADAGFFTIVDASLEEILAEPHAINVHESPENIQNYIACGDITGEPVDGQLEIELQELNDSGYSGMALLQENLDGTTTVILALERTDGATTS